MKLKFEKLPHQTKAVENILSVFEDCEFKEPDSKTEMGLQTRANPRLNFETRNFETRNFETSNFETSNFETSNFGTSNFETSNFGARKFETSNFETRNFRRLRKNIESIRKENELANYGVVKVEKNEPLNLDILMETGTGKTFTFIDTIYRLNQNFGLAKFIVLVPSNAIRAGTVKNLEITKEYFQNHYHKQLSVLDYAAGTISGFILNSNKKISVLIATFASFNRITNNIHKKKLEQGLLDNSKSYIEAIAKIKPVIIIDEPHRAGGEQTQKFLPRFSAQIIFRFGATYKKNSKGGDYCNLIYALDSATAFRENLVKSITVHSLGLQNRLESYLQYKSKTGTSGNYRATLEYTDGAKKQTAEITAGKNLADTFGKPELQGYIVEKITSKEIIFDNNFELLFGVSESCSELKKVVQKGMLKQAIDLHFAKEQTLFLQNIKALSLFFIDRVDDYLGTGKELGELAQDFERLYQTKKEELLQQKNLNEDYRAYLLRQTRVHNGYFSRSNKEKDNQATIDLILREKEKLLSFETPLRFIFSKWALQEGWDNPNIFTLTKLAPSASHISKLQQIGRGLRLAVTQTGDRITKEEKNFETVNLLDVVVAQDEGDFVRGIQENISENSLLKISGFTNRDLMDAGIFSNQREANKEIELLESLGFLQVDDNYSCELVLSKDEFEKKKTEIANEKFLAHLEAIYRTRDRVKISGRERRKVKINKQNFAKFKQLWENLNSKAVCRYTIDSQKLQQNIISAINQDKQIKKMELVNTTTTKAEEVRETEETSTTLGNIQGEDINVQDFFHRMCQNTLLSLKTLLFVMENIDLEKYRSVQSNPRFALHKISEICIAETHKLMVQGIGFEIVETQIKNTSLTDDKGEPMGEIDLSQLGEEGYKLKTEAASRKSIFENWIGTDSKIEKTTAEESNKTEIEVFAKLPKIGIETPIGKYTPDFAFVVRGNQGKMLYLVIETKGYDSKEEIPQLEQDKISVGEKFCEALREKNKYLNIHFKTKINREKLGDIISEIQKSTIDL